MKFPEYPVFCVTFPDFYSLFKIPWLFPDWKMPSHFPGFPVRVGTLLTKGTP